MLERAASHHNGCFLNVVSCAHGAQVLPEQAYGLTVPQRLL